MSSRVQGCKSSVLERFAESSIGYQKALVSSVLILFLLHHLRRFRMFIYPRFSAPRELCTFLCVSPWKFASRSSIRELTSPVGQSRLISDESNGTSMFFFTILSENPNWSRKLWPRVTNGSSYRSLQFILFSFFAPFPSYLS